MRVFSACSAALLTSIALAGMSFSPQPMKQSEAEMALDSALDKQGDATKRVLLAESYLERHPDDIPLGQTAADVILSSSMDKSEAVAYLKEFAAAHPRELGPQYYYAYVADDTLIWEAKARHALAKDSTNSWAWLMWANAEWRTKNPDLDTVAMRLEQAVRLDPSRPEAYLSLGDVYMAQRDWQGAVDAYRAGLICDPESNVLRLRLEDAMDRVRRNTEPDK